MSTAIRIGRCIYCGDAEPPLSREHVVPFGLEANITVLEASCAACAQITGAVEGYVLGRYLGAFRQASDFRSRKKTRVAPKVNLKLKNGDIEQVEVEAGEFPKALILPVFPTAGALSGAPEPPPGPVPLSVPSVWTRVDHEAAQKFAQAREAQGIDFGIVDNLKFARMLAKIAHVAAVLKYGLGTFQPLATDLILGKSEAANYLVGSGGTNQLSRSDLLHVVDTREHAENGMIVGLIKLFAYLEAPTYHVLVGLKPGGRIAKVL